MVLAASAFQTTITEKAASDGTLADSGVGLTVVSSGKVGGGSVTPAGLITITAETTSVGTAVTILLTPTRAAGGVLLWACNAGAPAQFKFVPAECRHA